MKKITAMLFLSLFAGAFRPAVASPVANAMITFTGTGTLSITQGQYNLNGGPWAGPGTLSIGAADIIAGQAVVTLSCPVSILNGTNTISCGALNINTPGSVSIGTLDSNGHSIPSTGSGPILSVSGGSLNVGGTLDIEQPSNSSTACNGSPSTGGGVTVTIGGSSPVITPPVTCISSPAGGIILIINQLSPGVNVRSYVPAAAASGGYASYLRVINTGTAATPINVAAIDASAGTLGIAKSLIASLPAGAALTIPAQQVEAALGAAFAAADRPRLRVSGNSTASIEVQTLLLQPGMIFNELSAALTGSSVVVSTYLPAAGAPAGYQSYLRVINAGSASTMVTIAHVDPATGAPGVTVPLIASLPAGAALTYDAAHVETALGLTLAAGERPTMIVGGGSGSSLEVQSFITQPGGAFTNVSTAQNGAGVDVRNFIPAASTAFTTYLRLINAGSSAAPVTAAFLDAATGAVGSSATLVQSLPTGASVTLTSAQVETLLGTHLAAGTRPRLRVSAAGSLTVQSFVLQPGGAFNEFSGARSGTAVIVPSYVPAAVAASGYVSTLRVINTGSSATAVSVAYFDDSTGALSISLPLIASLPAGAAQNVSSSQIEAALGAPIAASSRPRLLISGDGTQVLEVQSLLTQPGGVLTEMSGGQ